MEVFDFELLSGKGCNPVECDCGGGCLLPLSELRSAEQCAWVQESK